MKIVRLSQYVMLSGMLGLTNMAGAWNDESDAMQITTHFNNLSSIACDKTAQYCISIGTAYGLNTIDHIVYTSSNAGVTWNQDAVLPHLEQDDSIEDPHNSPANFMMVRCDTTGQHCLIAGSTTIQKQSKLITYRSQDAGHTWTGPTVASFPNPSEKRMLSKDYPTIRLHCDVNATWCILGTTTIVGNQSIPTVFSSQNGGESWSATDLSVPLNADFNTTNNLHFQDLDCDQSEQFCTALTITTASKAIDNKALSATIPFEHPQSLVYSTHDGGVTWSDAKPFALVTPKHANQISKNDAAMLLSCDPSGLTCIALGEQYYSTSTALETNTHAYLTKNGGLSWEDSAEIPAIDATHTNIFTGLHCDISNRFCTAVGMGMNFAANLKENEKNDMLPIIFTTIDGGQTWQKKALTPTTDALNLLLDVFCSEDASLCHAVGFFLKP